jgi:predicted MFS family arabinose efflux permease
VNTYLNDFLASDRGMSVEFATLVVLVFGLGNFFGMILGGQGGKFLYCVDKRYPVLLAGSMAIFGCFPFWYLLNEIDAHSSLWKFFSVSLLAGTASGVTGPIIKATLQNVTLPQVRGLAFSIFNTFDDFGRGLGPVFVAMLIDCLGGRTPAFNIGVTGWLLCGIFNLLIFLTVAKDEEKVQDIIRDNLSLAMISPKNGEHSTERSNYSDDGDSSSDELIDAESKHSCAQGSFT